MDKMKMMFSMEAAKAMVAAENKRHKQMILGQAICVGVCSLIFCALYFARANSVNVMQVRAQDAADQFAAAFGGSAADIDYIVYDRSCSAPYSDVSAAAELAADLAKDCDLDCQKAGSRWSHVYFSMGFLMLFVLLATICVCVGVYKPVLRCIASCCMSCLCCAHFCTWIAVAVYRFRDYGKLCALSKAWTNYTSTDLTELPNDDWTMEKDGALILGLWVMQLLGCCCCCFAGVNMPKPARMQ